MVIAIQLISGELVLDIATICVCHTLYVADVIVCWQSVGFDHHSNANVFQVNQSTTTNASPKHTTSPKPHQHSPKPLQTPDVMTVAALTAEEQIKKLQAELAVTNQNHEWIKSELHAALALANHELELAQIEKDEAVAEADATRVVCVQLKKTCESEQEVHELQKHQWHQDQNAQRAALSEALLYEDEVQKMHTEFETERSAHASEMTRMAQELQAAEAVACEAVHNRKSIEAKGAAG